MTARVPALGAVLILSVGLLTSCGPLSQIVSGKEKTPTTPPVMETEKPNLGVPEDSIDFELEPSTSPDFQDGYQEGQPSDSVDLSGAIVLDEEGEGAEEVDAPSPIDPSEFLGEEPTIEEEPTTPVVPEPPVVEEEPSVDSPSAIAPTEKDKYPNTGKFLEDD